MEIEKLLSALLKGSDWLSTVGTVAVAVITFLITRSIGLGVERSISGNYERKVLVQELEDIVQHLGANIVALSSIDLMKGWPSTMHIAKCKVPEGSLLFDLDSFRKLRAEHATAVYHAKLVIRNLNIEADTVIEHCVDSRPKTDRTRRWAITEMPDLIQYMIVKQISARKVIEQCIDVLRGSKIDTRDERVTVNRIVYE